MIKDLILKNRSYRRFHQEVTIDHETLKELVDLARLSASASNLQPLRYMLSSDPEMNARIFTHLAWAGYLKDWPGPEEGERPSAYIIILKEKTTKSSWAKCDLGIAIQNMLLGAVEKGLGGCIIASVDRDKLRDDLKIPARYDIFLVIALGKPKEDVVIDSVETAGDIEYWRESDGTHHVPKRSLDDIIIG